MRAFYGEYMALLRAMGLDVHVWPMPVEVPDPIPLDQDEVHGEYDPAAAHRFWQVLRRCDAVLRELAGRVPREAEPGPLLLGQLRPRRDALLGPRAPRERPGADRVTREAYSHEVISFGFWPGGALPDGTEVDEPILYAYAAPEPPGFRDAPVSPPEARYDPRLGEFVLPWDAVRAARDPAGAVRAFCESVYGAGATLGGWDRAALERTPPREAPGAGEHAAPGP